MCAAADAKSRGQMFRQLTLKGWHPQAALDFIAHLTSR
jgi:hypothetical protein